MESSLGDHCLKGSGGTPPPRECLQEPGPGPPLCTKKPATFVFHQTESHPNPPAKLHLPSVLAANKIQDLGNCMEVTNLPVRFPTGTNKNQTNPMKKIKKETTRSIVDRARLCFLGKSVPHKPLKLPAQAPQCQPYCKTHNMNLQMQSL